MKEIAGTQNQEKFKMTELELLLQEWTVVRLGDVVITTQREKTFIRMLVVLIPAAIYAFRYISDFMFGYCYFKII